MSERRVEQEDGARPYRNKAVMKICGSCNRQNAEAGHVLKLLHEISNSSEEVGTYPPPPAMNKNMHEMYVKYSP